MEWTDEQVSISQFVDTATQYCGLIEDCDDLCIGDFLFQVQMLLSRLYNQALGLPEVSATQAEWLRNDRTSAELGRRFENLKAKLGKYGVYWLVYDPIHPSEHDAITQLLADDLIDIYAELNEGVVRQRQYPELLLDTVWQWKQSFQWHWGPHITSALKVIHFILYGNYGISETDR